MIERLAAQQHLRNAEREELAEQLGIVPWKLPLDPERERLRQMSVDECAGCRRSVRGCPIHGLNGSAPR